MAPGAADVCPMNFVNSWAMGWSRDMRMKSLPQYTVIATIITSILHQYYTNTTSILHQYCNEYYTILINTTKYYIFECYVLLLYYYLFQIILKPIKMPHNKYVEILCNTSHYYNNQYYTILQNTTQILPNTTHR